MRRKPGKLLRIYVNERDRHSGKALYEAIVERCRELKVAGATVFRALEGYGETDELHHAHWFQADQPIVITIVDSKEKAEEIMPVLQGMMNSGLIVVSDVEIISISKSSASA